VQGRLASLSPPAGTAGVREMSRIDQVCNKWQRADSSELIGWKQWVDKERRALSRSASSGALREPSLLAHRQLIREHMSQNMLYPDPAYKAACAHLKGVSRDSWKRFAGDADAGADPVLGYSVRWAASRSRLDTPFSSLRRGSESSQAFTAPRPLHIKPVDRALVASRVQRPQTVATPQMHRVMSMEELAPDLPERRARRQTEKNVAESTLASIAFSGQ